MVPKIHTLYNIMAGISMNSSSPISFPLPDFSELQELDWNVEGITAPVQSSTSQTNIAAISEVDSSLFELISTFQPEAILSSSDDDDDSDDDFTNSSSYKSSSPEEEATVENIKRKLSMYQSMLDDNKHAAVNPKSTKRKKFSNFRVDAGNPTLLHHSIDTIENSFRRAMCEANMQGYVYGIILQDGSVILGSSPSLRQWWHETVRFGITGKAAVDRYHMENQRNSDQNENAETPRQTYDVLMELSDATLGSLLSAMMNRCKPPQRKYPLVKKVPPPWWPTGSEPWWNQIRIIRDQGAPPYRKPHDLRKMWKAAVIVAIIKHTAPAFDKLARVVRQSKNIQGRMSVKEMKAWNSVLEKEAKIYSRDHPDHVSVVPELPGSFLNPLLSDSSTGPSNHVEGFQSRVQHHDQVSSMCNFPTEQRMMNYTCDHPMYLHRNSRFGFPTAELRDQHFWSCGFRNRNAGGQFGTPIELPAFPASIMCQDTNSPLFPPCPEAPGAPYQQMDTATFQPVTHQPPNPAYEAVTVAFSDMDPQQHDFSFDGFRSTDYSATPNNGQHMGPSQSDVFGHGFFTGEGGRYGNAELFI